MRKRIDPMKHPLKEGESWWMVHPNDGKLELKIPVGAPALCMKEFLDFGESKAYKIVEVDDDQGWVSVEGHGNVYEMPRYIFARYFDAIPFIRGGSIKGTIAEHNIETIRKGSDEVLFEDSQSVMLKFYKEESSK